MRSFGVMGGGFRPASTLIQHRKLRPRRVQQLINQQRERSFTHFNKTRFQIFNTTTQTWANQIDAAPILLIEHRPGNTPFKTLGNVSKKYLFTPI